MCCVELDLSCDLCSFFDESFDQSWEDEYIIDLIGEVTASGSYDSRSCSICIVWHDLGSGICECKNDRLRVHGSDMIWRD